MSTRIALCTFALLSACINVHAQAPSATISAPAEALVNQDVCFNISFSNAEATGFQPYLRVFLPPQMQNMTDVMSLGEEVTNYGFLSTVVDSLEEDLWVPNQFDDAEWVAGPMGYDWYNIGLPIGTMVPGELDVDVSFCTRLVASATLNEPITVCIVPVFLYGGDPSGAQPPVEGEMVCVEVSPIAYTMGASTGEAQVCPGPCWPVDQTLSMDIALNQFVTDLTATVDIPEEFIFDQVMDMTPGCALLEAPEQGENGGQVLIECANIVGTEESEDVFGVFRLIPDDVLDHFACTPLEVQTLVTATSDIMPDLISEIDVDIQHVRLQLSDAQLTLIPGSPTVVPFEWFTNSYFGGVTNWSLTFNLADGLEYTGGLAVNGIPIDVTVTPGANNSTDLTFDLTDQVGDIPPCNSGQISIPVLLNETRADGSIVHTRDLFPVNGYGTYDIVNGALGCTSPVSAAIGVGDIEAAFEITSTPETGDTYSPSEQVVYTMTAQIPSEDARDVRFELLLPVPVHDADSVNLEIGNGITIEPATNVAVTPSVWINPDRNAVILSFGDLSRETSGLPIVIQASVAVDVEDAPFASGLRHSCIAKVFSSNSILDNAFQQFVKRIEVGAPEIEVFLGPITSDNPTAVISDLSPPYEGNIRGVDGQDNVDYRLHLRNISPARAYNVIVFDSVPFNRMVSCIILDVHRPDGTPIPYSGEMFESGLLIEEIPAENPSNTDDVAYIDFRCFMKPSNSLKAGERIEMKSVVDWAASPTASERFEPLINETEMFIATPTVSKTILSSQPGIHAPGTATIGELVTIRYDVIVPEARSEDALLVDVLDPGLAFEPIDSVTYMSQLFTSPTNIANLEGAAVLADVGEEITDENRRLTLNFGDISNFNVSNDIPELISLYYPVRVLNSPLDTNGAVLSSTAEFTFTDEHLDEPVTTVSTCDIQVAEPLLSTETLFNDTQVYPGDGTYFTLTVDHLAWSGSPAYNIVFDLDLPLGLSYVPGSFISECPELLESEPVVSFGALSWSMTELPEGLSCQFQIGVEVDAAFPPCSFIETCLSATWRSLDADAEANLAESLHSLGAARTGNSIDPGGTMNTYHTEFCETINVINGANQTPFITAEPNICSGETLTLSCNEYDGNGVIYHWTGPEGPILNGGHELVINNASETNAGDYQVWVEVGDCYTPDSEVITVEVYVPPAATVASISEECILPGSDLILEPDVNGTGPFDFFWSGPDFVSTDSLAVINNAGEEDSGPYELQVTDQNGCSSSVAFFDVDVTEGPGTPGVVGDGTLCNGEDLELAASDYGAGTVYHWITPTGETTTTAPQYTLNNAAPMHSGSYAVWVEVNGCSSDTSSAQNVNIALQPPLPEINTNASTVCENNPIQLTTTTNADQYLWTGPNDYSSASPSPPVINNANNFNQGNYTLQVWVGGCASQPSDVYINVIPQPEAPVFTANGPVCEGGDIVLTASSSAESFSWTLPSGLVIETEDGVLELDDVNLSMDGDFTLEVFDGQCWSATSVDVDVEVEAVPAYAALAGDDLLVCEGGSVNIASGNGSGPTGYWSALNGELVIAEPEAKNTIVSGLDQGESYWLTWSLFTEGCGVYSVDSLVISTPVEPEAVIDYAEAFEGSEIESEVLVNDWWAGADVFLQIIDGPIHGVASADVDDYIYYSAPDEYYGFDELTYEICMVECPSLCDTALLRIEVLPLLNVPDIFTPNEDGFNDTFIIEGLGNFDVPGLVVFNRWGREVFRDENYQNDWNGTWNGEPLPEGTYYFTFYEPATSLVFDQGYVIIKR